MSQNVGIIEKIARYVMKADKISVGFTSGGKLG